MRLINLVKTPTCYRFEVELVPGNVHSRRQWEYGLDVDLQTAITEVKRLAQSLIPRPTSDILRLSENW